MSEREPIYREYRTWEDILREKEAEKKCERDAEVNRLMPELREVHDVLNEKRPVTIEDWIADRTMAIKKLTNAFERMDTLMLEGRLNGGYNSHQDAFEGTITRIFDIKKRLVPRLLNLHLNKTENQECMHIINEWLDKRLEQWYDRERYAIRDSKRRCILATLEATAPIMVTYDKKDPWAGYFR